MELAKVIAGNIDQFNVAQTLRAEPFLQVEPAPARHLAAQPHGASSALGDRDVREPIPVVVPSRPLSNGGG